MNTRPAKLSKRSRDKDKHTYLDLLLFAKLGWVIHSLHSRILRIIDTAGDGSLSVEMLHAALPTDYLQKKSNVLRLVNDLRNFDLLDSRPAVNLRHGHAKRIPHGLFLTEEARALLAKDQAHKQAKPKPSTFS